VIALPEKVRRTLEKAMKELRAKASVHGVGLFGSWSRGDAEASSDIDLFILDRSDSNHEYVERTEVGGLLVDLDHVPKQWTHGPIPPEIDQKLYEMQILYDRDWTLANTKLLMAKSYASPERIDIRTEAHVIDSDIYLSRATSAFSRDDFQSAQLFSLMAFETVLRILGEISLEPFSNSRLLERFASSARKLSAEDLSEKYMELSGLDRTDEASVRGKLKLFKAIWDEVSLSTRQDKQNLESAHFKVRTKLGYYLNPAFIQGAVLRASSLADSGRFAEASHYLDGIVVDLVQNFVWLKSSTGTIKLDHTTLMRSLQGLGEENYERTAGFLGLNSVGRLDASHAIEEAREAILKTRRNRKALIKNRSLGG